jgi:hypothetical protein
MTTKKPRAQKVFNGELHTTGRGKTCSSMKP